MVKKLRRWAPVISINVAILLSLLIGANLVSAVLLDTSAYDRVQAPDSRASLPNYDDQGRAAIIFEEFDALRTRYEPFVGWTRREFHGVATTVNAEGDRVHQATTERPVGTVRFFGGSTVWGTGVDDEGTLPAWFNRLLPDYRVLNHGEAGLVSRQSLARLINFANRGMPLDLVVFYEGVNDVFYYCHHGVALNAHGRTQRMAELIETPRTANLLFSYLNEVADKVGRKLRLGRGPSASPCQEDPAYARRVADLLIENWKIAQQIVAAKGGRFVALLQPVAYVGNPRLDHLDLSDKSGLARDYGVVYPLIKQRMAETGASWMFDFSDSFDGNELFYIDFCHVSRNGNRLIAQRLAGHVGGLFGSDPSLVESSAIPTRRPSRNIRLQAQKTLRK